MSWSISYIGTSEKICAALDEYETTLSDQSLQEFQEVKDSLKILVNGNVGKINEVIQLTASGHATFTNGIKSYGNLTVSLSSIYAKYLA